MDDLISRQAAIDKINERQRKLIYCFGFENDMVKIMDIAKSIITIMPSVQPEIIRCKDCKNWNPQLKTANGNGLGSCDFHKVALVTSEGFCYWAEKGGDWNETRINN